MSVRGTTHARITRKAIIREDDDRQGGKISCCWDECDRDGLMLYRARINDNAPGQPPRHVWYLFCSERHKQLWIDSYLHPCVPGCR